MSMLYPSSPEITAKNIEARIAIPWIRVAPGANCNTFDLTVRGIDRSGSRRRPGRARPSISAAEGER